MPNSKNPLFECSEMYQGKGLDALFAIAVGLRKAAVGWLDEELANEKRLGPVVARHGKKVYKAYDDPLYRQPNLEIVQEMFDDKATEWKSEDKKLTIVETNYVACNWKMPVSCAVFFNIFAKLNGMHEKDRFHGDIRLANLLYKDKEGFLIDFDFVGHKLYPRGLRQLNTDGKRHEDVNDAIEKGTIESLSLAAEHDRFSLGEVMRLFKCDEEEEEDNEHWEEAIKMIQSGTSLQACNDLWKSWDFLVKFASTDLLGDVFETGPTPRKPPDQKMRSVAEENQEGDADGVSGK